MAKKKKGRRPTDEVNASSMADIAFLLLIFFLVTTTIVNEKGLIFNLPEKVNEEDKVDELIAPKNIYNVILNSGNRLLVENEPMEFKDLKSKTMEFIDNRGKNPKLSVSPKKAVVTFKADRGADAEHYILVLNELKAALHELRAGFLGISNAQYLKLDVTKPDDKLMLDDAKKEYPSCISEAEPFQL